MDEAVRQKLETDVRELCARGDHSAAATAVLRGYGPELFGFLVAVQRSETEASDAFAELSEAIWKGLPRFAWASSVRTWTYSVARQLARTRRRDAGRRQRRVVNASESFFQEMADKVRTETLGFLRTERKTRLRALRDALPEEDRMLLVLRIDRGLAWNDLARILSDVEGEDALDDAAVAKEAARLRKRFQLVKDRLRAIAKKEGLLE